MLVLEDGQVAWGDCAAVQYSGAGGRDPLFLAEDFIPVIDKYIKPALVGKEADNFRELTKMMEAIEVDGKRLHTAIRYGVSQAILDAVAKATKRLMSEVVADEYGTTVSETPIPIFTQSGDNRYENADKMILKGAAILPHALINNVDTKLEMCIRDRLIEDCRATVPRETMESINPIEKPCSRSSRHRAESKEKSLREGTRTFARRRINQKQKIQQTPCAMTVATAAPAIPMENRVINRKSSAIFNTEAISRKMCIRDRQKTSISS